MTTPWIDPPRTHRPVSEDEVDCPQGDRTINIDRCRECPYLDEVTTDAAGVVTELVCDPAYGSLGARPLGKRPSD